MYVGYSGLTTGDRQGYMSGRKYLEDQQHVFYFARSACMSPLAILVEGSFAGVVEEMTGSVRVQG